MMTMAEKVLARTSGRDSVSAGEYVTAAVDRVMAHEAWTICALRLLKLGIQRVFDPEKVIVILDHYFPASDIPPQVRRLYDLNRVRSIPDALAPTVPVVPPCGPGEATPLDMSRGVLRKISASLSSKNGFSQLCFHARSLAAMG